MSEPALLPVAAGVWPLLRLQHLSGLHGRRQPDAAEPGRGHPLHHVPPARHAQRGCEASTSLLLCVCAGVFVGDGYGVVGPGPGVSAAGLLGFQNAVFWHPWLLPSKWWLGNS